TTAPDAGGESLFHAPTKPRVAPSAPTPAPAFAADPRRNTPATRSGHRPRAAPHPAPRNSADGLPNKIRPPRRCDANQTLAGKAPTAPAPDPRARCRRQTDESSRSDDARWPNSTPARDPALPCSTTPTTRTSGPTHPPAVAAQTAPRALAWSDSAPPRLGPSPRRQ